MSIKNNTTIKIWITFNGIFEDFIAEHNNFDGYCSNENVSEEDVDKVKCQVNNEAIVDYLHSKFDEEFEDIQLKVSCDEEDDGQYLYKSKPEDDDWTDWITDASMNRLCGYVYEDECPKFYVEGSNDIPTAFLNSKAKLDIKNAEKQDIYLPKQYSIYIPKDTTIFNVKAVYRIIPDYIALTDGNIKMKFTKKEDINEIIESDLINQINDYLKITSKNDWCSQITNYNVDMSSELVALQIKYEPYKEFHCNYFDGDEYKCFCILNNVKVNDAKILQHWYEKTSTDVIPKIRLQFKLKLEYFTKINNIDQIYI